MEDLKKEDVFKQLLAYQEFLFNDRKKPVAPKFIDYFNTKSLSSFHHSIKENIHQLNDLYSISLFTKYARDVYYQNSSYEQKQQEEHFNLPVGVLWLLQTASLNFEEQLQGYQTLLDHGYWPNQKFVLEDNVYDNDFDFLWTKHSNENIENLTCKKILLLTKILMPWLIKNSLDIFKTTLESINKDYSKPGTCSTVEREHFLIMKEEWKTFYPFINIEIEKQILKEDQTNVLPTIKTTIL